MRLLVICSRNRLRSPTAEAIFATREGLEVASAGTAQDAECPVDAHLIEWAETLFVMEQHHANHLRRRFAKSLAGRRLIVLGIPDEYTLMDPDLVALLQAKVEPYLAVEDRNREPEAV